ncbi:MAG: hypothetical protein JSR59_05810 [Proteobacteria bacterium]|nr:hypothetical protein [Pseudomonadota bacterium]
MKLKTVPARDGALWVRRGFIVFFRHPMIYTGLFAAFMFLVFVLVMIPLIGVPLLLAVLPLVSLGFMVATRAVVEGRQPTPAALIEPLRTGKPRLIALVQLGIAYAAATFCIQWLSDVVDGGALDALLEALPAGGTTPAAVADKLSNPQLGIGLVLRFGLAALLALPFWHAPALVHWGAQSAGKALFFSTMACWRNRGAFVLYVLTWGAVIMVFALLANIVFALLGQAQWVAIASMPASLMFSAIFYASLYFTFAACFVDDAAAGPAPLAPLPPAA